ncbi:unnamed protein product [Cylicocyclus nassatus]|uniref:Uncharacterized protein n=1 Tax=Cylicocyclus nassatus TaxID=53992 RepID=A0AA36DQ11_CYLNA|nr:unnamed protein product [Cylicocyclus nassatus]
MGVAFRLKESIEEKLRNEVKKVQRHLRQEKEKYTGTGGGSYRMTKLAQYLQPLADALAEKHHIRGVPGIKWQEEEDNVATRPSSQECLGLSNEADSVPSSSRQRSAAAVVRESLSLFSDKRKELYEEEIKLARLKQKKIQLEIEVAELKKEEAKLLLDAAKARHVSTTSTAPAPAPSSSTTSPFGYVYYQDL